VALLRESHERFESTWRDYHQRRDVRLTFGEFAEKALTGGLPFQTPELAPQVNYCAFANHFIRWDFAELAKVLGAAVPHINRTNHEPVMWPAPIRERFAERYAADLKLVGRRQCLTSEPNLLTCAAICCTKAQQIATACW
jgi:hypothetical protein